MYSRLFFCYDDSAERKMKFRKGGYLMDATTGTVIMILCYVFGTGLMIAEAFMPGFGVAGISGIILEIIAIVLTGTRYGLLWGLIGTFGVLLFAGVAVFISYRSAMKGRLSKSPLVLKGAEKSVSSAPDLKSWLNKEGAAVTALRPAGFIEIDGTRLNASTSGEFLEKGAAVRVSGAEGDHLVVRKL
jgi:membrane-bound ClpP family serine protease